MPIEQVQNLTSLECISGGDSDCITFMFGRMPEFFGRNVSLQSLKIFGFHINEQNSPRVYMDNLTSLVLGRVSLWYLLFDLLQIKSFESGTFTTISFSGRGAWVEFSAVNSIGFSLTATISLHEDSREDDFMCRYFSGATLVCLEDFQTILNTKRLFSILRILGDSEGDMGRLELHAVTEYPDTDTQVTIFAKPFLPRLRTLAIYLPDWTEPSYWVEAMVEDLFAPGHHARFPDECTVEVYDSDSSVFLLSTMGELRAEFEEEGLDI
jgi:hypothetical protein